MDRMVLESYKTLCEGLANYLGDGYEIVLHSLENYDNSVIKIINGYYTGRKEGAPITDLALHMLEDIRHNNGKDYIAYYSKNKRASPCIPRRSPSAARTRRSSGCCASTFI